VKLYLAPHACSLAVDIVARELGIPLILEWVDVRGKKLKDGSNYFKINAKGQVPMLELDDGQLLSEGQVIIQLLADSKPGNTMLAASATIERYRVLEWLSFICSELHKGFTPLFRQNTPPAYRDIAIENLARRFSWLDEMLTHDRYLTGEEFTAADAYCYTIVSWAKLHNIALAPWPHLAGYIERVDGRRSVKAARLAEADELQRRVA
jgi:glutathione S-transferase